MKNKQYYLVRLLLCTALVFIAFSCKDNEEDLSWRTNKSKESALLLSATPSDNATISLLTDSVILAFDRTVTVADKSLITFAGEPLFGDYTLYESSQLGKTLALNIGQNILEENTTVTLTLPKGTVKSVPGMLSEDITLKYTVGAAPEITKNLVTATPSAQAKKVYDFLLENYRKKIISGTVARVNWNTIEADSVFNWTKDYPAINTFDYIHHYADWINYNDISVAEKWWNNNGLVSIMWHWNVPVSEGSSDYGFYYTGKNGGSGETSFNIAEAVKEGTYENTQVKKDMDIIAGYLLKLQAKGIPVIWRPLHEASGGWFWWGANGSEACKELWIMMFDAFKAKGINNLIWVWTTQTGDMDWYPGDEYVDIIGRDIYNNNDPDNLGKEYWSIRKDHPNKIIALSECGNVSEIPTQWDAKGKWSWFMPWYDYNVTDGSQHIHATKEFWINAFGSDKVITRKQMPSLK